MNHPFRLALEAIYDPPLPLAPECQACHAALPGYVEAELDGRDPTSLFPDLPAHLAACSDCQQAYEELRGLLQMERQGQWEQPPLSARFDFSYLPSQGLAATPPARFWRLDELGRLVIQLSDAVLRSLQPPVLQPAYLKSAPTPVVFELPLTEVGPDLKVALSARQQRGRSEVVGLTIDVDVPSRGGWPNLTGIVVSVSRGAEMIATRQTDPFGQALVEGLPAEALPELTIAIEP